MEKITNEILNKLCKDWNDIAKKKHGKSREITYGDFIYAVISWNKAKDSCKDLGIGEQTFNRTIKRCFPDVKLAGGGQTWSHYLLSLAGYKRCFKCNNIKSFDDFYKNIEHCKQCHSIKNKKYYAKTNLTVDKYNKIYSNVFKSIPINNTKQVTKKKYNKYSKDIIIKAIKDFAHRHKRLPMVRDFCSNEDYPSFKTVQNHFGTWNNAIEAAGFEANIQNGFGIDTYGLDGHLYRSKAEAYLADNFLYGKYNYIIEPTYPESNWLYDWYIPELDLYIELDGGIRPERIEEKIRVNNKLNRNLLVISVGELYSLGINAGVAKQVETQGT